jgi:ornithine cyclodeaminase/alanine dehydrogenase-like protein (mu-crystallin family)
VRYVTDTELRTRLTMSDAIELMREAFIERGEGRADLPDRAAITLHGARDTVLCTPGALPDRGDVGMKLVSVFPDNPRRHGLPAIHGLIVLLDPDTGQVALLLDAAWITALRTGAVSGLATRYLARTRAFVASVGAAWPDAHCEAVTSADDLAAHADIIVAATNAPVPLFDGAHPRSGAHVNAIGAFTPDTRELDGVTLARGRVSVDDAEQTWRERGDLLLAVGEGLFSREDVVGDLGDLCTGWPSRI